MKIQLAFLLLALSTALVFGQSRTMADEFESYGTGVVLVPIDRVALTITVTGYSNSAASAVSSATNLQRQVNDTLRNYTIHDIRMGGLYLEPIYQGSSLSFDAHMSLSVILNAADLPTVIDQMVALGVSNISFVFTPDFYAVELAQRQSLQLAVADALYKTQSVLSFLNLCSLNISRLEILNPSMELPSLTFNLFANMGNLRNTNINNLNINNFGSAAREMNGNSNSNSNSNNFQYQAQPLMLGAASPIIEGDNQEVISYVRIWTRQTACTGSGAIQDLTSSLDLSNIVGISGGLLGSGSFIPSSASASASASGSGSFSGSGSGMRTRSVRSTMW